MLFDQEKWLEDEEAEALLKRTVEQKDLPEVKEERK
jgi:DNA-directed RNA polymerase subunit H (RpoH/RPB5)